MKLAILLYGTDAELPKLTEINNKLQDQLNLLKGDDESEVVYYINSENTVEEKKQWLLSQTDAKKYVWVDSTTDIPDNFILKRLNAIKYGHSTEKLIKLNVFTK